MTYFKIIATIIVLSSSVCGAEPVDFSHDVLPILKSRCAKCHSNGTYKGGMSLDTRDTLMKSETVVAGNASESELFSRITSADPETRMPSKGEPLSEKEIAVIRKWIDDGVAWQDGFSFKSKSYVTRLSPRRPDLPPAQDGRDHPLDRIVDTYFDERQVIRPELADDSTFLRRAHLDLVGELPNKQELDEFLSTQSPEKRARAVRLLLSDCVGYADHWLTFWNDLLRNDYEGTGYIDGGRKQITSWLYESLLENKPYDQFVSELISPTSESEGFIKGILWRGRVNASQVYQLQFAQNVSQVMLGINIKCASCHDSFINDWKLKDAYGLAAIISDEPIEIHRCDKPTGEIATASFLFPEIGSVNPELPKSERLAQLAELITSDENGRFARTIANRLWHRLMGRGIVHPVDIMSNRPWSEDVIDYLASELVDSGYDLKNTIELIATSQIYASQSVSMDVDVPEDEYVFRGPLAKRLTAEQFVDALWSLTGNQPPNVTVATGFRGGRTIRASLVGSNSLMRSLGRPNREQVVTTRPDELSTLQALDLTNGEFLTDQLMQGMPRLRARYANADKRKIVADVFRRTLSRDATEQEFATAVPMLGGPVSDESLADLYWSVIMLPEFQFVR